MLNGLEFSGSIIRFHNPAISASRSSVPPSPAPGNSLSTSSPRSGSAAALRTDDGSSPPGRPLCCSISSPASPVKLQLLGSRYRRVARLFTASYVCPRVGSSTAGEARATTTLYQTGIAFTSVLSSVPASRPVCGATAGSTAPRVTTRPTAATARDFWGYCHRGYGSSSPASPVSSRLSLASSRYSSTGRTPTFFHFVVFGL